MQWIWIWIILSCFSGVLHAQEEEFSFEHLFDTSLVNTSTILPTTVHSVSVISGAWLNTETDFALVGPEPLILNRSYSTEHLLHNQLGYHWCFNRPQRLVIEENTHHHTFKARYEQASGITTLHTSSYRTKEGAIALSLKPTKGLTNCRSGKLGARSNLYQLALLLDPKCGHCVARSGSHHVAYFKHAKTHSRSNPQTADDLDWKVHHFRLDFERQLNGNWLVFNPSPSQLTTYNPTKKITYNWLSFHYANPKQLDVTASDGKWAIYSFALDEKTGKQHYLEKVKYSHQKELNYEYAFKSQRHAPALPLLKKKMWPEGRFQAVDYYHRGNNVVDGIGSFTVADEADFRYHRIKTCLAPVGTDATPIAIERFVYQEDNFGGKTIVYDAYLNKTEYVYNTEKRLTKVQRFDEENHLAASEGYIWDDPTFCLAQNSVSDNFIAACLLAKTPVETRSRKRHRKPIPDILPISRGHRPLPQEIEDKIKDIIPEEMTPAYMMDLTKEELIRLCLKGPKLPAGKGHLQGKYLQDGKEQCLYAHYFDYDEIGNVEEESLYGKLTSLEALDLLLDSSQNPKDKGVESYHKWFAYYPDERHLLHAQGEDNGKGLVLGYYPDTDLIQVKYVMDNDQIRFRQFFYYDDKIPNFVTCMIQDDGSHPLAENLEDVTERHITYFSPRNIPPHHLPARIEEKYLDLLTGQERLLKRQDLHYSLEGYLERKEIYDAQNVHRYSLLWEYDAHGNVKKETNALGHTIIKDYDDNDNLKIEKGPKIDHETHYDYDFANRLIKKEEKHPYGSSFITHYRYDFLGNRTCMTDRYGQETHYIYDALSRLIKTIYPLVVDAQNIPFHPYTTTKYDAAGRPIVISNACQEETETTYNARGAPLLIKHPDGRQEKFIYNLDGTLAKKIESNGTYTIYQRDFLGRILKEEIYDVHDQFLSSQSFVYKGWRLISKTDALNCTTSYTYDGAGRLVSETCENALTTYAYDELGRLAYTKEYFGFHPDECQIQAYTYDALNQILEEHLEDAQGHILACVRYVYDEEGNRTEIKRLTEAGEANTRTIYNSEGAPLSTTDATGQITHFTYNYFYPNALNQLVLQIQVTDPQGRTTHMIHDALGRIVSVIRKDAAGFIVSLQDIFYDGVGRRTKVLDTVVHERHAQKLITTLWSYHPSGQEKQLVEAEGDPLQRITYAEYNAFAQKERVIKPDGTLLFYTYDALGRLQHLTASDQSIDYTYTYNARHQIESIFDAKTQTTTRYDYYKNGWLKQEAQGTGLSLTYIYDRMGRPTEVKLPDHSSLTYHYNAAFLKAVSRNEYTHTYQQHDLSGKLLSAQLIGQAGSARYTHDLLGRVKSSQHPHWTRVIPDHGYDNLGRLVYSSTSDKAGHCQANYTYDDLDHLKTENNHFAFIYQTDSLHNRLFKNNIPHAINVLHQLISQGHDHYGYDTRGNLIEKSQGDHAITYAYDAFDRLIRVRANEEETTYQYDALNRRIAKIHKGQITRYFYQGQDEIGSVDASGKIQELRLLGTGINAEIGAAILVEIQGRTFAPLHDHQGNVVCLLDAQTGEAIETYRYSAFGEEAIFNAQGEPLSASQIQNPWRFASKRVDPETGWIYFGRRYYDPSIGRWTTPDPIGFADGSNLYAYLHHNPLGAYDAYGLLGEAYAASVNAACNAGYCTGDTDVYAPVFANESYQPGWSDAGQSFVDGFVQGVQDPLSTAWQTSGIGLLQQDFYPSDQPATLDDFCEQAGSICGSWFVLAPTCELVKLGYGFTVMGASRVAGWWVAKNFARTETLQVAFRVAAGESGTLAASKVATDVVIQSVEKEVVSVAQEVVQIAKQDPSNKILQLAEKINEWLGAGTKMVKNKASDPVFLSQDGLKRVRFDFNNPAPHSNPHGHIEKLINGKWNKSGPIYPTDVPHN